MKKLIIISILINLSFAQSINQKDIASIDFLFNEINKPRYGLDSSDIDALISPFGVEVEDNNVIGTSTKEKQTSSLDKFKDISYTLYAILNEKANINGNWYGKEDKVGEYVLELIDANSVTLKNVDSKKVLKINEGREDVVIKIH